MAGAVETGVTNELDVGVWERGSQAETLPAEKLVDACMPGAPVVRRFWLGRD